MNRKKSLGLMKIACGITLALGIVLFGGIAPAVIRGLPDEGPLTGRFYPALIYVELVGVLCFLSLWQAWKICREIGNDNSFSHENARSLTKISRCMAAACALMALGLAVCLIVRASLFLTGLAALGTCIALIFSLFAAAMAQLIESGAALKDENDLTI